jgi:hypothetical protein
LNIKALDDPSFPASFFLLQLFNAHAQRRSLPAVQHLQPNSPQVTRFHEIIPKIKMLSKTIIATAALAATVAAYDLPTCWVSESQTTQILILATDY